MRETTVDTKAFIESMTMYFEISLQLKMLLKNQLMESLKNKTIVLIKYHWLKKNIRAYSEFLDMLL